MSKPASYGLRKLIQVVSTVSLWQIISYRHVRQHLKPRNDDDDEITVMSEDDDDDDDDDDDENVVDSGARQQRPDTGHSDTASQMHGKREPVQ